MVARRILRFKLTLVLQILDFMDTVFIVARGKWDQFSFLHIYHHSSIFMVYWLLTVAGAIWLLFSHLGFSFNRMPHMLQAMTEMCITLSLRIRLCISSCMLHLIDFCCIQSVLAISLLCRYLYYFLTCFNIKPTWGKNLTQLQMIQFVTMNGQAIYNIVFSCPYPLLITKVYLAYILSLFALFMQFYLQRWSGGGSKGKGSRKSSANSSKKAE